MKNKSDKVIEIKNLLKINGDEWVSLKLPSIGSFLSRDKRVSPYDKLYQWIFSKIEKKENMNVSDVFLKKSDALKLDELTKDWMKNTLKLSNSRVDKHYPFYHMDRSPAVFDEEKDSWPELGKVYIRNNSLGSK